MGRLSWIVQVGPKGNHTCPYQREAQRDSRPKHTEKKACDSKAEMRTLPPTKECWQPPEAERGKKPLGPQE